MKSETQKRYLRIYQLHLEKKPALDIAAEMGCSTRTVENALRLCRKATIRPTRDDELLDAIDSARRNLARLYERLAEIQKGVQETTVREDADGTIQRITKNTKPITAEVALFREIREHEKLLSCLQGITDKPTEEEEKDKQIIIEFVRPDS